MGEEESDSRKYSASDNLSYQSVPDADREIAVQAFQEFEKQKYGETVNLLKKLLYKRPQDTKVLHNYTVAEYYLSGCKETEHFKKKMAEVCRMVHIDLLDLETIEDVDNCIILYNQSVVLYHLHQYHAAINILDKVYKFIEPLEETLARNTCFLLIECYLAIYQPKKALNVIGFVETVLSSDKNCNKSSQKEKDVQKEENNDNGISEALKRKLQLCKARTYAMMKTAKACKREIKNLLSSGSNIPNIPAYFLKCQLEYQRGNYRKALKLLNSVPLPEDISKYFRETGDCLPSIFYNNVGCIHFYMGKPNLGQFYTEKALKEFENEMAKVSDTNDGKNPRPLHIMSVSTKHQLMYNLGMQYLQAKKFHKAFACFLEVVKSYHSNPRLWLRIAECCIHINKPNCMDEYVELKKKPFIKSVIGAGPHQKIIMNSSAFEKQSSEDSKNVSNFESPTLHFAMICLKNALFLVREHNSSNSTGDSNTNVQTSSEDIETPTSEESNILSVLPSNYLQGPEVFSLRNSILIACSYVSLSLGDVMLAHEYAKTLLSQPRISAAHKFLAHQYAGEALLIMDSIPKTVEHFNLHCANEIELAFLVSSSEASLKHQMRFDSKLNEKNDDGSRPVGNIPNWLPNTISSAKFVTQYNLAVAYACREEWGKAMECLNQMNPNGQVPIEALSLLIYIESHNSVNDIKSTIQKYVLPSAT